MTAKLHYQRDTNISASIPEWLADAVIVAANRAGCSKSEMVADLLCFGLTGINLMEHEGKYRREVLALEVSKLAQNCTSFGVRK
jgi:aryl carrier-like protein